MSVSFGGRSTWVVGDRICAVSTECIYIYMYLHFSVCIHAYTGMLSSMPHLNQLNSVILFCDMLTKGPHFTPQLKERRKGLKHEGPTRGSTDYHVYGSAACLHPMCKWELKVGRCKNDPRVTAHLAVSLIGHYPRPD